MAKEKIIMSWSGGKDSAMALYSLLRSDKYQVTSLLTVLTEGYDRISMHGVTNDLLQQQADSIGLPLEKVYIPQQCSMEQYSDIMLQKMKQCLAAGIKTVAFGDIFLEDLRKQREDNLNKLSMNAIFPLWKIDTRDLAYDFIENGFKTIITCSDSKCLDKPLSGCIFNKSFLSQLPANIDPCGENGEFHSFVFDGPIFETPVSFTIGQTILRDNRFFFCDLLPK